MGSRRENEGRGLEVDLESRGGEDQLDLDNGAWSILPFLALYPVSFTTLSTLSRRGLLV